MYVQTMVGGGTKETRIHGYYDLSSGFEGAALALSMQKPRAVKSQILMGKP